MVHALPRELTGAPYYSFFKEVSVFVEGRTPQIQSENPGSGKSVSLLSGGGTGITQGVPNDRVVKTEMVFLKAGLPITFEIWFEFSSLLTFVNNLFRSQMSNV